MQILRELLFKPNAHFTHLNISNMTSDHFSYHIKILTESGLVHKIDKKYSLTEKGKEYANTMDTSKLVIEKQGKICVLVIATKRLNQKRFILVQTRLKEPYFGFMGFIGGKVRFGETIQEAALRELKEETGLEAECRYKYTLHELIYSKENKLLEDKYFNIVYANKTKGQLTNSREGKNKWIEEQAFLKEKNTFYDIQYILSLLNSPTPRFIEKEYFVEKF